MKVLHKTDHFNTWSQLVVLFVDTVEPLEDGDLEEEGGLMKRARALGFYNRSQSPIHILFPDMEAVTPVSSGSCCCVFPP